MKHFSNTHIKTVKIDKTDSIPSVSNTEFLDEIFGTDLGAELPVIASFHGNPRDRSHANWNARAWRGSKHSPNLSSKNNNYFSLSRFKPDQGGEYRRTKKAFHALHAVMLDDVGTRVNRDAISLSPSWRLETSPGNYQDGYILKEPISDPQLADALLDSIIDAQLCDPGANGPTSRLARLPIGVNGKHEPSFQCRLELWRPDRRYSVQELIDGLALNFTPHTRPMTSSTQRVAASDTVTQGNAIWTPPPVENPVLRLLKACGLYKSALGDGKHDITCPWVEEHTDAIDGGTAYWEPDDNHPVGGFKCFHGHCAERHIRDLLETLDVEETDAEMKPEIRILTGQLHRVVDAAERALLLKGGYYQRSGRIVKIVPTPTKKDVRIAELSPAALPAELSKAAIWQKWDARSEDFRRVDPPRPIVSSLDAAIELLYLPDLVGIIRQPYLREDGSLIRKPYYDEETRIYGLFNEDDFNLDESPTREQAEQALGDLKELLREFSFCSEVDLSAALAAILTATVRPSLPTAPMFHVQAHVPGSGKSYLCEIISAFASPQRLAPTTFPTNDEECGKVLLAELAQGPAAIIFDNLTGNLVAHKSLCTILTSQTFTGRVLQMTRMIEVSTKTLFLSSGNNVGPIQDMTRRCLPIGLDTALEIPMTRTFERPDLLEHVLQNRPHYICQALTVIRAWIAAGRPHSDCRPFGSYGYWSEFCRKPLLWLGCADPVISTLNAIIESPDREQLAHALRCFYAAYGERPQKLRDIIHPGSGLLSDDVEAHADLIEIFGAIAGERATINTKKLGWWFKNKTKVPIDGLQFISDKDPKRNATRWRVEAI